MDGNGRWAEARSLLRVEGHRAGVDAVKTVVQSCLEQGISVLSLFAFSLENWSRPAAEVDYLMRLFVQALQKEVEQLCKNGVQLRFSGDRRSLSEALQAEMNASEAITRENDRLILNIAVNYSGKWEIIQAAKAFARRVLDGEQCLESLDEEAFSKGLCFEDLPDPDLLIRTSGEQRISNFFLWQLAYTELYFTQVHWPDFTAEEFNKALVSYRARERRYGLLSEQLSEKSHV